MSSHATGASAPTIPTNTNIRMSSLEIAELMKKRHDHVMRDIKKLTDEGAIGSPRFGVSSYRSEQNKELPMYELDFQATMILITGYDAKRRAAVIDRWMQLETGQAKPGMVDPKNEFTEGPEVDLDFTREGELMARELQLGIRVAITMGFRGRGLLIRAGAIVRQRTGTDFMDYFGLQEKDLAETRHLATAPLNAGTATGNLSPVIDEFLETCCRVDQDQRVQATFLYHRFVSWLDVSSSLAGSRLAYVPSQKAFGVHVSGMFSKVKNAGRMYYVGLALLESSEEVAA